MTFASIQMDAQTTAEAKKELANQATAREEAQVAPQDRARVGYNGGVVRFSAGGTETVNGGSTSIQLQSGKEAFMDASEGLLSTAHQQGNGRAATVIDGKSLITLPGGMEISIAAAVVCGYLRINAAGQYEEVK